MRALRALGLATPVMGAALALSLAVSAGGCSSSDDTATISAAACGEGRSQVYVITSLGFTREGPKGVAPGFDVDTKLSTGNDYETCGKPDLVDPEGRTGIDNQMALLLPDVEKLVGNAIDGLISGAINDGRLLIFFDMKGADDLRNDSCTNLDVVLGDGKPTLGTDGVIEAWQTFDLRKENQSKSSTTHGSIKDGTFTIGPFDLRIPIAIFDVSFVIHIREARIRFTIDEEGNAEGILGGGVSMDEIADGVKDGAGVADIVAQIRFAGLAASDLGWDPNEEKCKLMSAALAFKAKPAFLRR